MEKRVWRGALVIVPLIVLIGVHTFAEWLEDLSGRAFDRLVSWSGYDET